MIDNCDICKNKENCSKFIINSKEWNSLTCYDFNEFSSPQLVKYIIKNFCKDEHRSDLWINIEIPLYKTLKTLEIVKEKRVNVYTDIYDSWSYEEYVDNFHQEQKSGYRKECKLLTQEEYDLLREVLL